MFKYLLLKMYRKIRMKRLKDYSRVLPLSEYVVDRKEKAQFLNFGKKSTIYDSSYVFGNVQVGQNTWIGPLTILDGSGGLAIGNNCSISAGVQIYSHDTVQWAVSGGKSPYEYAPVKIQDNCYIGPNTIIQKGVQLGEGTIVGANSFVNKSFPKNSKIAGNPAKQISDV